MKISKIKIKKVVPNEGLIGFASCVLEDALYLGNIAIFNRLNDKSKIRLVFPIKEIGDKKISVFHPLTSGMYYQLEEAITKEFHD